MKTSPFFLTFAAFFGLTVLSAATFTFNGAAEDGNIFSTPGNWVQNGEPDTVDTASFSPTGELIINFTGNAEIASLSFGGSNDEGPPQVGPTLVLDLGGNTLVVNRNNTAPAAANTVIAPGSNGATRSLVIRNGTYDNMFSTAILGLNNNASTSGAEVLVDTAGHLKVADMYIGNIGSATTVVRNGGSVTSSAMIRIGGGSTSDSTLTITGATSNWTTTGTLGTNIIKVGESGKGTLEVLDGGSFTGRIIALGRRAGNNEPAPLYTGDGTLRVSGQNSSATLAVNLWVGGGASRSFDPIVGDGNGTVVIDDGGTVSTNGLRVFKTDAVVNDQPVSTRGEIHVLDGLLSASGTSLFEPGSLLNFGLNSSSQAVAFSAGTITISDAELELTLGDSFSINLHESIGLISYSNLTGTFAGLQQGDSIAVGDFTFLIDYSLDGNNVIGLTAIPEPASTALVLSLCMILALRYVRRR